MDSEILSTIPLPGETLESLPNDISPIEPLLSEVGTPVSSGTEAEDKEHVSEDQSKIVLKYTYKEDQWSPLNPEGKKQYDRDFLLQLQSQPMSLCKPTNLPNLDVIKDKAHIQRLTEVNRATPMPAAVRAFDPFMPNYARGGTPRPPNPTINRRSQQSRGGYKKTQKIIVLPSTHNIKLHESENAWKPSYKVDLSTDNAETQDTCLEIGINQIEEYLYHFPQSISMEAKSEDKAYKNTYASTNISGNLKQNAIPNESKELHSKFPLGTNEKNTDWNKNWKIKAVDNCNFKFCQTEINKSNFCTQLNLIELSKKHPNDILLTILDKRSGFLQVIEKNNIKQDIVTLLLTCLGKACTSNLSANVCNLVKTISCNSKFFLLHMQQYLVFLQKQEIIDKVHIDAIFFSTVLLEMLQSMLPSTSSELISILSPLLDSTCTKCLNTNEDMHSLISEKLREIDKKNLYFLKNFTSVELKKESQKEKLQLQEPPENFRSLPVLPTIDDIRLPCSFLRPNIAKGKYKNVEHYLDVQYRLLREDFIQPLREGIIEYLNQKKAGKCIKNYQNIKVYYNVSIEDEDFINGELLHLVQFSDKQFSTIKWESNKRFLTGSLLCFSLDDFETMLFASIVRRNPKHLEKGLLIVHFEEITEVLKMSKLCNFVVIETSAYFEAYRHNLNALRQLNIEMFPLKKYIIDVEKHVSNCKYLHPTVTFDMRPLLIPLDKKYIKRPSDYLDFDDFEFDDLENEVQYQYPENISTSAKFIQVMDEHSWPKATELNLDDSQYLALKSAILKEFSIIQGPPGTGKTYIGLRVVQLLLHNLNKWSTVEREDKIRSLPILVICYTNHALDQFLEGMLLFTTKICRIGGRGTNEEISKFNLSNIRKSVIYKNILPNCTLNCFYSVQNEIKDLKHRIDLIEHYLEISTKTVLSEVQLEEHIPFIHYNNLVKYNLENLGHTIYNWLFISKSAAIAASQSNYNRFQNQDGLSASFVVNNNFESEDEADIEYIENQRNIDINDYDGVFNTVSESVNENRKEETSEWKTIEGRKQHLKRIDYIKQCMEYYQPMEEEVAMRIKCVWSLDLENRWQLYKYWILKFTEETQEYFFYLQYKLKNKLKELDEIRIEEDLYVLRNTQVVGVTTTGAAKYRHLIQRLQPMIVIAEEAAEVLESHIITSLAPTTQHVILIGDHQQLRPSPTVHMLAVKYDMNISLFERMINNEVDYCRLSIQHRMRPDIAALIVPHIYSNLENHPVVTEFENIKGVKRNVFFVSHNFNESPDSESKSKVNEYEAKFIIQLCRYLILQGYDSSQITVLTTYSGQLFVLKQLITDEIKKVRFTVVDNFQGEENDIILISFVRSNDEGVIGFLKVPNRVCVALSRAKKGLFCIGNFKLLAEKSNLWKNIVETLNDKKSIGSSLQLTCQNHPDIFNDVAKEADFNNVPDGGCNQKCEFRLLCGHTCNLMCHPYSHEFVRCEKPCTRICEKGHACEKGHPCYQECNCEVLIEKTLQRCGHTVKESCWKPEEKIVCKNSCRKSCEEGHDCQKLCSEFCGSCSVKVDEALTCGLSDKDTEKDALCQKTCESEERHPCLKTFMDFCGSCEVLVDKTLDRCGHVIKVACGKKIIQCNEPCIKNCTKGHQCPKKCYEVCGQCKVLVDKTLDKCGHVIKVACGKEVIHCNEPCIKTCTKGHLCPKKCFEICGHCQVLEDKTLKRCGHTVKGFCWESENRVLCSFQCEKIMPCSHQCTNKCGEFCIGNCKEPCIKTCEKGHPCLKKCFESCGACAFIVDKTLKKCGHAVKAPCGMAENEIKCYSKCKEALSCFHNCTNKCGEPCLKTCMEYKDVLSPLCGHSLKVNCYIANNSELLLKKCSEELFKICSELCTITLSCGHKCKGTCGKCYQGRLHVPCKEACQRILICGHKCKSICCKSCPPCQQPCENKCLHLKCNKKCNEPCRKCTKTCEWFCIHKKCTRQCSGICDRKPCDQPCTKILNCDHPCIGICGEPCPKECRICDSKKTCIFTNTEECNRYVLLEDCKHVFEINYLNKLMMDDLGGDKEIILKRCPTCKSIIRKNMHYNNVVKNSLIKLEKVKQMIKWNKEENVKFQSTLFQKSVIVTFLSNFKPSQNSLFQYLSSNATRNIQELITIENIISITTGLKHCSRKTILEPHILRSLIEYIAITCNWLSDFILKYFLTVSEYQLIQIMHEVHRLILINQLLDYAEPHYLKLYYTNFENCSHYLLNYTSFDEVSQNNFVVNFQVLYSKLRDNNDEKPSTIEFPLLKAMDLSTGHWYECSKGHLYCIAKYVGSFKNVCYKCKNKCDDKSLSNEKASQEASGRPPPVYVWAETEFKSKEKTSHMPSHVHEWSSTESRARSKRAGKAHCLPPEQRWTETETWTTESQTLQENSHYPPGANGRVSTENRTRVQTSWTTREHHGWKNKSRCSRSSISGPSLSNVFFNDSNEVSPLARPSKVPFGTLPTTTSISHSTYPMNFRRFKREY